MQTRLDSSIEEIDIVVENRSEDPIWKHDKASYILGECKNWSTRCGAPEIGSFFSKLSGRHQRARTGFFFSTGGFTAKFHEKLSELKSHDVLVIPVDRPDLERWIDSEDRVAVLGEFHERAVFGTT